MESKLRYQYRSSDARRPSPVNATNVAADTGHLDEHGLEPVRHPQPDAIGSRQARPLANHHFGMVEPMADRSLHRFPVRFKHRMNSLGHWKPLRR